MQPFGLVDISRAELRKETAPVKKNIKTKMNRLHDIFFIVCDYYGTHPYKARSRNRQRMNISVRRMFCYVCVERYAFTLVDIGRACGVDHATVIYHHKKMKDFISVYPKYKADCKEIKELIESMVPETDISKRHCTAMGYLGLAYVFNMEVDF